MRARILAATNRELDGMIASGTFREDLFFRLNVLTLHVPPLRERGDDVLRLARTFLRSAAAAEGTEALEIDDEVAACFLRYAWPGNVRELEHALRRATVLATGATLTLVDLPVKVRGAYAEVPAPAPDPAPGADAAEALLSVPRFGEEGMDLDGVLRLVEGRILREALELTGGNRNRAAALVGLPRSTFLERLKRVTPGGGQGEGEGEG
jgi:DNA-binding NtrC family response regulator